jgi:hypothetical protein
MIEVSVRGLHVYSSLWDGDDLNVGIETNRLLDLSVWISRYARLSKLWR